MKPLPLEVFLVILALRQFSLTIITSTKHSTSPFSLGNWLSWPKTRVNSRNLACGGQTARFSDMPLANTARNDLPANDLNGTLSVVR